MTASGRPSTMPGRGPTISAAGRVGNPHYPIQGRITADGSSGFPAEPGRYHLYVSLACPFAHRTIIARKLLGLEDVVSLSVVDPIRDERGWAFLERPDPINGFQFLSEAYLATDPAFAERFTVPCVWDRQTGRLVSNHFPDITIDLETQFGAVARPGVDLYPEDLRDEIDAINEVVYAEVNFGVYRAGFATSQQAYEDAVDVVFSRLDWLEERLSRQRFLVGDRLTEADIRLFPTLIRFDPVYYVHFKCNLRRLVDYPNLWSYTRDLYRRPGFGETVDLDHIKQHYYRSHPHINPTGIVPRGPLVDWEAPHDRDRFPDRTPWME